MNIPYLTRGKIEIAASALLAAYEQRFGRANYPVVPVDEIVECLLNIDFGFEALMPAADGAETLGAMWVAERRVRIAASLDPTEHPQKEGRYRFTVGHELGHWELHRPLILAKAQQNSFFDAPTEPTIICRAPLPQTKKPPIEWQADMFSGCLLMPEKWVRTVWADVNGTPDSYVAAAEIGGLCARWSLAEDHTPTVKVSREIAEYFHVSAQAMQVRLIDLGLLKLQEQAPQLFDTRFGVRVAI